VSQASINGLLQVADMSFLRQPSPTTLTESMSTHIPVHRSVKEACGQRQRGQASRSQDNHNKTPCLMIPLLDPVSGLVFSFGPTPYTLHPTPYTLMIPLPDPEPPSPLIQSGSKIFWGEWRL
jgi:hypothetical protein